LFTDGVEADDENADFHFCCSVYNKTSTQFISEHSIQQRSNASMTTCRFVTAHR